MYRVRPLSLSPLNSPTYGPCQGTSHGAAESEATSPQGKAEAGGVSDSLGDVVAVGQLWSVDASGLDPERLQGLAGRERLKALFDELIQSAGLHPVSDPIWHVFPGPHAGVTGIVALSESHLSCHSFPEHGGLALDLYTCRERPSPPWAELVGRHLGKASGAVHVTVQTQSRSFRAPALESSGGSLASQVSPRECRN